MVYAFIAVLVVAVVLGIAYYFQIKTSQRQAEEQQQLLTDYQRRVDEQQKLLDDYRALEKNFDNIGEGYEQALLAFDKMDEESQKMKSANEALEKRNAALQDAHNQLTEATQKRAELTRVVMADLHAAVSASGDVKMKVLLSRLDDLDDLPADQAPLERTDNVMVTQVVQEAILMSGIDKAQYVQFVQQIADEASYTMVYTNQAKAVRALTHLLDNALKFTTEGTITLKVAVDMDKMQVAYTVEDTGSGIEAGAEERIFEPYVKLNQYFDGQGIGLTVARNIARRLEGDLVLDTTYEGPGARFVLTLPI